MKKNKIAGGGHGSFFY